MHSSVDTLNLEQVPLLRGPMMSLGKAASTLGGVIGSGLGGLTLILYGYSGVGAILGSFGIFSGICTTHSHGGQFRERFLFNGSFFIVLRAR
jgi:predicted MFS family arabinose efflux permease